MIKESKPWYKHWVAITLFVLFILILVRLYYVGSQIEKLNGSSGERIVTKQSGIEYVTETLQKETYEVGAVNYLVSEYGKSTAVVTMKALGDRNTQVWDGLVTLNAAFYFENASYYMIRILSPTQTCDYFIDGVMIRAYRTALMSGENLVLEDGTEFSSDKLAAFIDNQIATSEKCS